MVRCTLEISHGPTQTHTDRLFACLKKAVVENRFAPWKIRLNDLYGKPATR